MTPHKSRPTLDHEFIALRDNILRLASLVEDVIQQSMQALKHQDVELSRQIIAGDQKINSLRYRIEEDAYLILARQQPTARDLRYVIAAIHIAIELERMGDYASGVAKLNLELSQYPLIKPLIDIPRMADAVRMMLRDALNAYVNWDMEAARRIIAQDRDVDALDRQVYQELIGYMLKDPATINRATYLLWVSHNIERIGDRITNICERVIYMVTGEMYHATTAEDPSKSPQPSGL